MAIYQFTVEFEDYEDVCRVIELKSSHSFFDLHIAIQDAIGFDKSQLASFYVSDDVWTKGLEITLEHMHEPNDDDPDYLPIPIMKDARLCDFINDPHQRFVYIFDFLEMWTLHVELTKIVLQEDPKKKYPILAKSMGTPPKQYDDKKFKLVDDDELGEITSQFATMHHEEGIDEEDTRMFEENSEEEDPDKEEQEGSEYATGGNEDYE